MLQFIGTCVNLPAEKLDQFDESSRQITYSTFRRHLGMYQIKELNDSFGVALHKDYHVRFARGKYNGEKAICLFHSSIHYLWLLPKNK